MDKAVCWRGTPGNTVTKSSRGPCSFPVGGDIRQQWPVPQEKGGRAVWTLRKCVARGEGILLRLKGELMG